MPHFLEAQRDYYKSPTRLGELAEEAGPCLRDILRYIQTPQNFHNQVQLAMRDLNMETLIAFFHNIHRSSSAMLSNKLVLLWRERSFTIEDDLYFVVFKTAKIRGLILNHFAALRLEEAKQLFDVTKNLATSSILAGFVFEWLANGYISGQHQKDARKEAIFREFACMITVMPTKKFPYHFQHTWSNKLYVLLILMSQA